MQPRDPLSRWGPDTVQMAPWYCRRCPPGIHGQVGLVGVNFLNTTWETLKKKKIAEEELEW